MRQFFQQRPLLDRILLATTSILALRILVSLTYPPQLLGVRVESAIPFSGYLSRNEQEQVLFFLATWIFAVVLVAQRSRRLIFLLLTCGTALLTTIALPVVTERYSVLRYMLGTAGLAPTSGMLFTIDFLPAALFGFTSVIGLNGPEWRRALLWGLVLGGAAALGHAIDAAFGDWPKEIRSTLAMKVMSAACAAPFACAAGVLLSNAQNTLPARNEERIR